MTLARVTLGEDAWFESSRAAKTTCAALGHTFCLKMNLEGTESSAPTKRLASGARGGCGAQIHAGLSRLRKVQLSC